MPGRPLRVVPGAGIELEVQVVPRSSQAGLGPLHGDRIKARVTAPPVDGAANEALRELLADLCGVPRAQVTIVRGATGRKKTVRVLGDPRALQTRVLGALEA